MMKKIKKFLQLVVLLALFGGTIFSSPLTSYATTEDEAEEELPESEAWDKVHAFGSNAWSWAKEKVSNGVNTVKEKAPGWKESAKEGISNAQESISDYREQSEQSFWGHFEDPTGQDTGLSGRDDVSAEAPEAAAQSNAAAENSATGDDSADSKDATKSNDSAKVNPVKENPDASDKAESRRASVTAEQDENQEPEPEPRPEIETEPSRTQRFFDNQIVKLITIFIVVIIAVSFGIWLSSRLEKLAGKK